MKIAIIGSRSFNDWNKFNAGVHSNMSNSEMLASNTSFISGGANGTDKMAERLSETLAIRIEVFLPDYEKNAKGATHIRNRKIVDSSDRVIAFWDGLSKGTKSVIDYAQKKGKPIAVIPI